MPTSSFTPSADHQRRFGPLVRHLAGAARIPAKPGTLSEWPNAIPATTASVFAERGIARLWLHQREALEALWGGQDVMVATGTGSGKSLPHQVLAHACAAGEPPPWWKPARLSARPATVLYISPTKALCADQAESLGSLPGVVPWTLDGDAEPSVKRRARDDADVVLTNPDWLHASLLPRHGQWRRFLGHLAAVVVDESHTYKGLFGAHVAGVLRRLLRVAAHHGASPRVVCLSATCGNPGEHALALTSRTCAVVEQDYSAQPEREALWWRPSPENPDDTEPAPAAAVGANLMERLLTDEHSTLAFTRSRAGAEALALNVSRSLAHRRDNIIMAYRGGYLPAERRDLEKRLRAGDLLALATTSALELGIDFPRLEAVVVMGWPGTAASLWQRFGRAGRRRQSAQVHFVARPDPLDQYMCEHPHLLLRPPTDRVALDPANPNVLAAHLVAAAAEIPLRRVDTDLFGPASGPIIDELAARGYLRQRGESWHWTQPNSPTEGMSLRGDGGSVPIISADGGDVVGTLDRGDLARSAHPGAVYTHQGRTFVVEGFDEDADVVVAWQKVVPHRTWPSTTSTVRIAAERDAFTLDDIRIARGDVEVTSRVTGYVCKDTATGETLSRHSLDMPPSTFTTQGLWITFADELLEDIELDDGILPGALHAAEHTMIALLGAHVTSDRWDVGGLSTRRHEQTGLASIFIHDAMAFGAGVAHAGFDALPQWAATTAARLTDCECEHGCPSCVQSPKCGNGNDPLSKGGALILMNELAAQLKQARSTSSR